MPRARIDELVVGGERIPVEVVESLVRTYLVRAQAPRALAVGERVALVVADNPPVPCTVGAIEAGGIRLVRGTAIETRAVDGPTRTR